MSARAFHTGVALALLAALALRVVGIEDAALTQWDEGPYAGFAMDKGPAVREDPLIVYAPPLFPLLCGLLYRVFGEDPRLAIGLSALCGALAVIPAALLARLLFGALAGVLAAWFLAFEPISLAHARLALTESLFALLTLTTLWLCVRALRGRRARDAALCGIAAGLATCTKFHGFLPLAAFAFAAAADLLRPAAAAAGEPRGARLRAHARNLVLAGLCWLPFALIVLFVVIRTMGLADFSASRETWVDGLHLHTIRSTVQYAGAAIVALGSPGIVVLGLAGALLALRRARDPGVLLVLAYLAILALVLVTYRNYVRLLVPMLALLVVCAGHATAALAARLAAARARHLALALALLALITGARPLVETLRFRGRGYPVMARALNEQLEREPGSVVAVAQQALFPYQPDADCARTWWITEPSGRQLLADATLRYLVADQELARHARMKPHLAALAPRLRLLVEIDNPLPPVVLFDRLGPAGHARFRADPSHADFAAERQLRLYELQAP